MGFFRENGGFWGVFVGFWCVTVVFWEVGSAFSAEVVLNTTFT